MSLIIMLIKKKNRMLHARNMNRISKYDDNGESCLSESIKKISFDKNIFIKIFLLSDYKKYNNLTCIYYYKKI